MGELKEKDGADYHKGRAVPSWIQLPAVEWQQQGPAPPRRLSGKQQAPVLGAVVNERPQKSKQGRSQLMAEDEARLEVVLGKKQKYWERARLLYHNEDRDGGHIWEPFHQRLNERDPVRCIQCHGWWSLDMWTKLPHPCRAFAKLRLAELEGDARRDTLEDMAQLRDRAMRHNEKQEDGNMCWHKKEGHALL